MPLCGGITSPSCPQAALPQHRGFSRSFGSGLPLNGAACSPQPAAQHRSLGAPPGPPLTRLGCLLLPRAPRLVLSHGKTQVVLALLPQGASKGSALQFLLARGSERHPRVKPCQRSQDPTRTAQRTGGWSEPWKDTAAQLTLQIGEFLAEAQPSPKTTASQSPLWSCSHITQVGAGDAAPALGAGTPELSKPGSRASLVPTPTNLWHGPVAPPNHWWPCKSQYQWGPQPRAEHPTAAGCPPLLGSNWVQQHMLQGCFNPAPGGCNPVQDLQCPDPELSRRNSQINGVGGFVQ